MLHRPSFGTHISVAVVEQRSVPSRVFLLAPNVAAVEGSGVYQPDVPRKQRRSGVFPALPPVATAGRQGKYPGAE